jgi:DNA-binding CsgD family transcriptional regulator
MVDKKKERAKSRPKNGQKSGLYNPKLTPTEREVLSLFSNEFLTPQQVAIRRQVGVKSVYKIRKKLIQKGALTLTNQKVEKSDTPLSQPVNQIRLHAEHYVLNIVYANPGIWNKERAKGNRRYIDGNTIELNRNSIEVYSNNSFYGETPQIADSKAMRYWLRFFRRLEQELKLILVKERKANINRVRAEYAETNNELASKCLSEHQKVRVTGEDGKTWLVVDNSFNFNELETTHPLRSKYDMQNVVQPFFNDMRNNHEGKPPTLSDILGTINKLAQQNAETAAGLNAVVKLMQPQQPTEQKITREKPNYIG